MLRVTISQAEDGMVLAMPVCHPQRPSVTLLKPGAVLDEACIERLRGMLVGELWIEYPRFDSLRRFVSADVLISCREMTSRIARVLDAATSRSHARLDYHAFRQSATLVLESLASSPSAALFIMEMAENLAPPLRHACNVCYLSMLMGLKLDSYIARERRRLRGSGSRDLTPLGVGALLHDVGMLDLDAADLARWRATRDRDDPAWESHCERGHELVRREFHPAAAAAVLHHHQHMDGTGFPRQGTPRGPEGLRGSAIHVFARIVAVADAFDELRFPSHEGCETVPTAPRMPVVRALRALLEPPWRERLDPVVVRALLAVTPAFAPGSVVAVSDGARRRQGVVVDWDPLDPCRPRVEFVEQINPSGRVDPAREIVDLRHRRELAIVEADGFDVEHDHFAPARPDDFDPLATLRRLENAEGAACVFEPEGSLRVPSAT